VETKGDHIVLTKPRPADRANRADRSHKTPLEGSWEGLAKINGDIVYFSDNPWEVESD
jgi:hypothetical protein